MLDKELRKRQIKVGYLLRVLKANETFLKNFSNSKSNSQDLSLFIEVLRPYGRLTLHDLNAILDETTMQRKAMASIEEIELLKNAGLVQLRDPKFRSVLSREGLSDLAQRELGISKWKLMKLGRDDIEKVIENSLENVDTLGTIARRAASKER